MVDYITLEEILRDKEVLEFLKQRYEDRVPQPQIEDVPVTTADDQVESTPAKPELTQEADQTVSPEEPAPATPSPTYSFPSITEEDTDSPAECDSADSLKEEQQETQQAVDKEENKEEQQVEEHKEKEDKQVVEKEENKDDISEVTVSAENTDVRTSTTAASTSLLEGATDPDSTSNAEKTTPTKDEKSQSSCSKPFKWRPKFWEIKPPPIFITHQRQWNDVVVWCSERKIKLKSACRTPFGMKVTAFSWQDYQNFMTLIIEKKVKFKKKEETRVFEAAIRYVPKEITTEEIRTALLDEKIPVEELTRLPCQLKNLRATHDIVVVKVVWCRSGRNIYKYNPLHKLFDKRRHLFNQEDISPFEKYPFCKPIGLCNYKPPELFGITTGGYMERTQPPRYFEEESYYLGNLPKDKPYLERIYCTGQSTSDVKTTNTAVQDQTELPTTSTESSSAQAEPSLSSTSASSDEQGKASGKQDYDKDIWEIKDSIYKNRNDPIALVFLGMRYSHLINRLNVLDS